LPHVRARHPLPWLLAYYAIASHLPASYEPLGRIGAGLRSRAVARFLAECGDDVCIEPRVRLGRGANVRLGNRSGIGRDSYVEGLVVADDVMIGPELLVLTRNHVLADPERPIKEQGVTDPLIPKIGRGSWLGARVTLLPGVVIGSYCAIGAGSVVTKDVPDFSVAAGNPARIIRDWRGPKPTR
jgi:maltose O-acetyltransferase